MISQTAEYALRAVVCLAGSYGRALTTAEIAERTKVPAGYLSKVLQALARGRVVTSRRGSGGGFELARKPERTTVLDVVDAVDPIPRIRECPLGLPEHAKRLCPLHRRIDEAAAGVEQSFRATMISEMIGRPNTWPEPDPGCGGDC